MKIVIVTLVALISAGFYVTGTGFKDQATLTTVQLGERLFFDPILSKDQTISCASCHKPEFAFGDSLSFSPGINGVPTRRNTPSLMYIETSPIIFWDGRAQTVEHQAFFPVTNPDEMGLPAEEAVARVNKKYLKEFRSLFNQSASVATISRCLADFEKSLAFYSSPYDRFYDGNDEALTLEQTRGLDVFIGKAKCLNCHNLYPGISDVTAIRNIGLYDEKDYKDQGMFEFTKDSADIGKFKAPQLRNLSFTAPYMHNGSMKTIKEVIEYYNSPKKVVANPINIDPESMPDSLGLTDQEIMDLEKFLQSLTDDSLKTKLRRYPTFRTAAGF